LFVVIYAIGIRLPENMDEFESMVRDYLMKPGMPGLGAAICTAAVIDYSFHGLVSNLDRAEVILKMIAQEHPEFPQEPLLSLPMRSRHWVQAIKDWKALRAKKLSHQKLRDFADSLIRPPHAQ
jgi:hypothetical protein